ncbi:MAG: DUF4159 domain-containing protein [Ignavibacterium sp.]|jgi:hypothetical protein|nr:DUF4159 domain-containing protein [Ignavibacterium sp.]
MKIFLVILFISSNLLNLHAQSKDGFQIARLKYSGGGDWYNDPSAEVNLLKFVEANTNIKVKAEYKFVDIASDEIFSYPFLFITGHGNIVLSNEEVRRLRTYLENGGFLYIDDDYGLDKPIRREMKKVFPQNDFIEIPFSHKIFNIFYKFENGTPKTHEHDKKPPQSFGIFLGDQMVVFYTYESNPSDGWADPEVHNDPPEKREEALKFGTNIIIYALSR